MSRPTEIAAWKYHLGRLWFKCLGWKIDPFRPEAEKAVVIAAPHTTNWDFPFAMAVCWAMGVPIMWLAKESIFRFPFAGLLKSMGGIPVERSKSHDLVSQVAKIISETEGRLYVLVPAEGTRKQVTRWKTGFYYIAKEAKVPIAFGYLDYTTKTGGFGKLFYPTGDIDHDFDAIREFYTPIQGKHPEKQGPIRYKETDAG